MRLMIRLPWQHRQRDLDRDAEERARTAQRQQQIASRLPYIDIANQVLAREQGKRGRTQHRDGERG